MCKEGKFLPIVKMLTRGSCIGHCSPWLLESHFQGACLSFAWATLFFPVSIHKSVRHRRLYSSLSLFSHEMWSLGNSVLIFILTWSVKCEQLWSTVWCSLETPSIPILMALRIREYCDLGVTECRNAPLLLTHCQKVIPQLILNPKGDTKISYVRKNILTLMLDDLKVAVICISLKANMLNTFKSVYQMFVFHLLRTICLVQWPTYWLAERIF